MRFTLIATYAVEQRPTTGNIHLGPVEKMSPVMMNSKLTQEIQGQGLNKIRKALFSPSTE